MVKIGQNKYYAGVGGIGFDANIVSFINRWKKFVPRLFIYPFYIGAVMIEIAVCRSQKVRIKHDGDAEIIFRTPLSLEVVPGALKVIVPIYP